MPELVIESKRRGTQKVLVDEEDWDLVNQYKWHIWGRDSRNPLYALTKIPAPETKSGKKDLPMHRLIMNAPKGMQVDHINHNGLDNRKQNLRICTPGQNQQNQGKTRSNTSGFKGVSYFKITGKWRAAIRINKKETHIGYYDTPEEAAMAYDANANHYHGEYACLNFPQKKPNSKYIVIMPDKQISRNNTSGFRGVRFRKNVNNVNKWSVKIQKNKKVYRLGHFSTPEEAARAYDAKAKELYGQKARLNFPEEKA